MFFSSFSAFLLVSFFGFSLSFFYPFFFLPFCLFFGFTPWCNSFLSLFYFVGSLLALCSPFFDC